MSLKKKTLLTSEQQTKVVTNAGLSYFAQQFNSVVEAKVDVVATALENHNHDEQYADKATTEAHIGNAEIHITQDERDRWNAYRGELESLEKLITGKSSVDVVATYPELQAKSGKIGDLVYVLNTDGHPEGGEKEALGFIWANIDGVEGWYLFTDLEPSLQAKDLTVDTIAGIEGTTVQAVLEGLANKIADEVAKLTTKIGEVEAKLASDKAELQANIDKVAQDLADELANREEADKDLLDAINTVDGKVVALQGQLASDKAELEGKIQEVQTNLNAETTARQEAIAEVQGQISAVDTKVDQAVATINGEIAGLKEKDAELEGEIARVEGALTDLAGRVEANEGAIEELQTDAEAIKGRIDALEEQVGENLQGAIEALRTELKNLIDGLDARVTALEERATTVEGRVDAVEGEVDTLQGQVSTIEGKLAGIEEGAEVNQNAFSKILVNGQEVIATEKTDTFELAVTEGLLIEAVGKKITVSIDPLLNDEIDEIIASLTPSRR